MSLEISHTDFISVPTQDFERAAKFYGETLGLEMSKRYGRMPGGEFETGNLTLQVLEPTSFGQEFHPNRNLVAFRVPDVEAAKAELESQGVEFIREEVMDSGVCHMAFFTDPDGNVLCLHNRYAPPDAIPPAAQ